METIQQKMKDTVNDVKSLILAVNDIRDNQVRYEAANIAEVMLNEIPHFNQAADTCVEAGDEARQGEELAEQFFCSAWTGLSMAMVGEYDVTSALHWAAVSQMVSEQACSLTVRYRETLESLSDDYEAIMDRRSRLWSMATADLERQG